MQGVKFVFVGKTDSPHIIALIEEYRLRLERFIPIEVQELPDLKTRKSMSEQEQKQKEGAMILDTIGALDTPILLDERGKSFTSRAFAQWLDKKKQIVPRKLIFIIGGPYGFSDEVYQRCTERISLSSMTFSHQMVRLFLVEQTYRACTILSGHPYHHD